MDAELNREERERKKEKIRERYKAEDTELLEVIPGKKKSDFYDDEFRRVAVYVRVSTDNIQQTTSYELQKNYYEEKVSKNPNWKLVGIYADEGISGTSLKHREAFNRMIDDCEAGLIDLIITKSVARFARNLVDCISKIRRLSERKKPIGVFFESENIYSLNDNTEMSLSFVATMAQEESHIKSTIMNASIDMRFGRGIVLTPVLLGYDHDEEGKLTVNEDESRTVRLIFFMYLYGYSCQDIANALTKLKRRTKKGNTHWNSGSVLEILRNERYCGEVLTRKTFTPSYLDHKSRKNTGEKPQHRWKGKHEPIISKDDFIAVQHLIDNAKYGNKGILPELKIITEGALKGFISINPRWSGFKAEEYISLSESVSSDNTVVDSIEIEANSGEFDYRGFEVAREQFFNTTDKVTVTISSEQLSFSVACLKKLDDTQYIELLIHPLKKLLVVRTSDTSNRNSVRWSKIDSNGNHTLRVISGAAYLKTLYKLLGWKEECKYRIRGIRSQKDNESILLFLLSEPELYLSRASINISESERNGINPIAVTGNSLIAYPATWANHFGGNYYRQSQFLGLQNMDQSHWSEQQKITSFSEYHALNVTDRDNAAETIRTIIDDIQTEEAGNG